MISLKHLIFFLNGLSLGKQEGEETEGEKKEVTNFLLPGTCTEIHGYILHCFFYEVFICVDIYKGDTFIALYVFYVNDHLHDHYDQTTKRNKEVVLEKNLWEEIYFLFGRLRVWEVDDDEMILIQIPFCSLSLFLLERAHLVGLLSNTYLLVQPTKQKNNTKKEIDSTHTACWTTGKNTENFCPAKLGGLGALDGAKIYLQQMR